MSWPVVRDWAAILCAPSQEMARMHMYIVNCITGLFSASTVSALTNSL